MCRVGAEGRSYLTSLSALERGNPRERSDAAPELGILGEAEPSVIGAPCVAANDVDSSVAITAVTAIGRIGRSAFAAVPALAQKLGDNRFFVTYDLDRAGLCSGHVARCARPGGNRRGISPDARSDLTGWSEREFTRGRCVRVGVARTTGTVSRTRTNKRDPGREPVCQGNRRKSARSNWPRCQGGSALSRSRSGDEHNYQHILVALEKLEGKGRTLLQTAIREKQYSEVASLIEMGVSAEGAVPSLVEALKAEDRDIRLAWIPTGGKTD